MNYCYCFVVLSGNVTVWEMTDGQLRLVRRSGLESFPFEGENDLWTWWKRVTSYASGEMVDFIVLTDDDAEWQFEGFSFTEETAWNKRTLAELQNHWSAFGQVEICDNGNRIVLKQGDNSNSLQVKLWPGRTFSIAEKAKPKSHGGEVSKEIQSPQAQPSKKKNKKRHGKPVAATIQTTEKQEVPNNSASQRIALEMDIPSRDSEPHDAPRQEKKTPGNLELQKPTEKSRGTGEKGDALYEYLRTLKEQGKG